MQFLMNLEAIIDIHRLFSEINCIKTIQAELTTIKNQYADVVNELMSIEVENSQTGEELATKALELGQAIQQAASASLHIEKLEQELMNKYGFLRAEIAA